MSEEYIKRSDAIKAVDNLCHVYFHENKAKLEAIPAEDVAPVRHGEWVAYPECFKYANAYAADHIVCSNCEECFSILDNCTESFYFCPHCGAVMDGDE